jgi:hypothetical protein
MATKISVKKGSATALNVIVSAVVAWGAVKAAQALGITIDAANQAQITVAITAGISGAIAGALNFWKHRRDPKPVAIPK